MIPAGFVAATCYTWALAVGDRPQSTAERWMPELLDAVLILAVVAVFGLLARELVDAFR